MEIFTSHIDFKHLQYIVQQNLAYLKNEDVKTFPDTPSMLFYSFSFSDRNWQIVFHHEAVRYGFSGTLMSVELKDFNRESGDEERVEKVAKLITEALGGFTFQYGGEVIEGFERGENYSWIIKRLMATGYSEEKIDELLGNLLEEAEQNKNRTRDGN